MKKWKITFALFCIMYLISVIRLPFSDTLTISDFIGAITGGLTLIPLYGFAYKIAVGSKLIAKLIFAFNGFIAILGIVLAALYLLNNFNFWQLLVTFIFLGFLYGFMYPQYMYAFRSQELWAKDV
ncbi:hypothetical protein [Pseudoalteromonas sp. T1lg75]|uniref:hypothetical protein n=1 Tax=Pseudoalteromonas sp. T1lg75 TaxID=2077102 RepID=UPI000CF6B8F0|nr:hypothetical protein [Pseudoalteromonas sp. T1lg75]